MSQLVLAGIDLAAVGLLVFALYFPRHRRRDLAVAYLGVNVGVFAVATSLGTGNVGAGLGLGLFGVLSIIRLRSTELDQHEVAYYFSALALGILGPIAGTSVWVVAALTALVLVVMFIGDHPRLLHRHRRHVMVIDTALIDPVALTAHLEQLLGARVHAANVERIDLVNDTTVVDVRYSRPKARTVRTPVPAGVAR
ncbi:DUF4956 domain-containing protein [Micromonospora endophytica]|uniref:DUF4956 domain-containing protein n=1 Tax=Micromonospora endophytica TaxID=515350 RepID=A0A2W2DGJ3_9ACTN|nr:DUF4956 domain-containing protein [Micromonospora endophytica]PZF99849.1 DUF4956 domain-containing protein [Micromonospora endophytica]RIW41821.1 DUF4956 domain-containing protein [Micromonospora endophytica]BCJ56862.1 DUF4956 domain-containing protein [Micromonospora endophytica]